MYIFTRAVVYYILVYIAHSFLYSYYQCSSTHIIVCLLQTILFTFYIKFLFTVKRIGLLELKLYSIFDRLLLGEPILCTMYYVRRYIAVQLKIKQTLSTFNCTQSFEMLLEVGICPIYTDLNFAIEHKSWHDRIFELNDAYLRIRTLYTSYNSKICIDEAFFASWMVKTLCKPNFTSRERNLITVFFL